MAKTISTLLFTVLFTLTASALAGGQFYREYWAEFDENISNHPDGRWRVNDETLSLHENFGHRVEAKANGLMLVNVPEDLFGLDGAELYLELWGGHGKTEKKRFYLNGRGPYLLPLTGTEEGHETYSYPVIPLKVHNMVNGVNAIQFAASRDQSFWGHFIIDNAAVRCILKPDHEDLAEAGLDQFQAVPVTRDGKKVLGDRARIVLETGAGFHEMIESVDYYGLYLGFDDNGSCRELDWHGFTFGREPVNHLGTAAEAPFEIEWDTSMLPDQGAPMSVRAVVHFSNGLKYRTPLLRGLEFPPDRAKIQLYRCYEMPVPFHSRVSREAVAKFYLPETIADMERAQLWIKTWDGGEGTVKEPFKINGHPYNVISGQHIHDVVFTVAGIEREHLRSGVNEIRLLSDTEHHGIEILLPGPCIIVRYKR